jgi:predicted transcriptional regulator
MAKKTLPPLTETQIAIMNIVWDRGETTVGEVYQELAEQRGVARNAVLTIIQRLYEKSWLRRRESGNTHLYRAAVGREKAQANMLQRLLESAFEGSAEGMVMTLLNDVPLAPGEADRIRKMLDRAKRKKDGK